MSASEETRRILELLRHRHKADDGWATGQDRFGPVTWVRVAAGKGQTITLDMKK